MVKVKMVGFWVFWMLANDLFLYDGYVSSFPPVFVDLCQAYRNIYGRNDTRAMGRFF